MDCRQTAEHLAGGREGLTARAGREEFASEKKAGLAREWRRRVLRLGAAEMATATVAAVARIAGQGIEDEGVEAQMTAGLFRVYDEWAH